MGLVKEEEAGHKLGSLESVQGVGAAPRTWGYKVVPSSAFLKALAVRWLPAAHGSEPPAPGAPPFRRPLNAHVTLQFVLQRTLQGAI